MRPIAYGMDGVCLKHATEVLLDAVMGCLSLFEAPGVVEVFMHSRVGHSECESVIFVG